MKCSTQLLKQPCTSVVFVVFVVFVSRTTLEGSKACSVASKACALQLDCLVSAKTANHTYMDKTDVHVEINTDTDTYTHTDIQTQSQPQRHTQTQTQTHTDTQTHTHLHTTNDTQYKLRATHASRPGEGTFTAPQWDYFHSANTNNTCQW